MLQKTQGIVLTHYKYGESSLVVHIFTQELGIQSYMVNGVWKKNAKFKAALFQPLTILNMQVYFKQNKDIQRLKEVELYQANHAILGDVNKSSIALFISELLHKTLKVESADNFIYDYLRKEIEVLESNEDNVANFLIDFLRNYSSVLGIIPQLPEGENMRFFDLLNGKFDEREPLHPMFFKSDESALFKRGLSSDSKLFTRTERQKLTDLWLEYYKVHFETVANMKSLKVLREVFS